MGTRVKLTTEPVTRRPGMVKLYALAFSRSTACQPMS